MRGKRPILRGGKSARFYISRIISGNRRYRHIGRIVVPALGKVEKDVPANGSFEQLETNRHGQPALRRRRLPQFFSPRIQLNNADVNKLFPHYINDTDLFLSLATRNIVRTNRQVNLKTGQSELEDLSYKVIHSGYFTGISYIYYAFVGKGLVELPKFRIIEM